MAIHRERTPMNYDIENLNKTLEDVWRGFEKAAKENAPREGSKEREKFDERMDEIASDMNEVADLLQSRHECQCERDAYADAIEEYLRDLGFNVWQWIKDSKLRRLRDAITT